MSSSNFGDPSGDESVEELIRRSIALMRSEDPEGLVSVVDAAAGIAIAIDVDGEQFVVVFDEHDVVVLRGRLAVAVRVATDHVTIADVLSGRELIHDAIIDDRLRVLGEIDQVVLAYDALVAFVRAATTSMAQEELYRRFAAFTMAG